MTAAALNYALVKSARSGSLGDLWTAWRMEEISTALPGMASFADSPSLGNKIRGALGDVLLESASPAVRSRQPCNWAYTSTAEVFYGQRPVLRLGDHDSEIARPCVLAFFGDRNSTLSIRVTVFGLACERTTSVAEALISALRNRVKWQELSRDGPRFKPDDVAPNAVKLTLPGPTISSDENAHETSIAFLSEIDGERGRIEGNPEIFAERLARRIALMAPWHGVSMCDTYPALLDVLRSVEIRGVEEIRATDRKRGGQRMANRLSAPLRIRFGPGPTEFHQALALGQHLHIGRGASLGLGRYRIERTAI